MNEYFGFIGIILGFALSQFATTWKEYSKGKDARKFILEELKGNLAMLPQKIDVLQKVVAELDNKKILPAESVSFMTKSYDLNYYLAFPYLSPIEKDSLHVIYETFKIAEKTMTTFETDLLKHLSIKIVADPYVVYSIRFKEILDSLRINENLIKQFILNSPVNVFYRK